MKYFWQLFNLWSVLFTTAACHVSKRPIWQPRKSFLFECVPWYCCQRKCHFDRAHNWGYYLWRHIIFISKNLFFHKRNAQIGKKYCTEVWFTIIGNPSLCSLFFWYLGAWFETIHKLCSVKIGNFWQPSPLLTFKPKDLNHYFVLSKYVVCLHFGLMAN